MAWLPFFVALVVPQLACARTARGQPEKRAESPPVPVDIAAGPRAGFTLNSDQAVVGLHLEVGRLGLPDLAATLPFLFGFGDDYLTFRPSLQVKYYLHIGPVRIYPLVGASLWIFTPVGAFSNYCNKLHLPCSGFEPGAELGGGLGVHWFAIEAMAGVPRIPTLTMLATMTVPLVSAGNAGREAVP